MFDRIGVGTHFLKLKGVLDFEGFDGRVDVDFYFDLEMEEGGQNADGLEYSVLFFPSS